MWVTCCKYLKIRFYEEKYKREGNKIMGEHGMTQVVIDPDGKLSSPLQVSSFRKETRPSGFLSTLVDEGRSGLMVRRVR
jgi:hypothetical protein